MFLWKKEKLEKWTAIDIGKYNFQYLCRQQMKRLPFLYGGNIDITINKIVVEFPACNSELCFFFSLRLSALWQRLSAIKLELELII